MQAGSCQTFGCALPFPDGAVMRADMLRSLRLSFLLPFFGILLKIGSALP